MARHLLLLASVLVVPTGSWAAHGETLKEGFCMAKQKATSYVDVVEPCVPFEPSRRFKGVWIVGFEMGGFREGLSSLTTFDVTVPTTELYFRDNTVDRLFDAKHHQPRAYYVQFIGKKSLHPVGIDHRIIIVSKLIAVQRVPAPKIVASRAK